MNSIKSVVAYAVITPQGYISVPYIRRLKSDSIREFIINRHPGQDWSKLRRHGYKCIKVNICESGRLITINQLIKELK